jgi:hypothetical protein
MSSPQQAFWQEVRRKFYRHFFIVMGRLIIIVAVIAELEQQLVV